MKIVMWAIIVIAGVGVLIMLIGWALPKSHTAAVEARYRATPQQVYDLINDVARGAEWRTGVERIDVLSHDPLRWRETADWGALTFVQETSEPGHRIVARIVDDGQGFGGAWTWEIDSNGAGSVLRITERGEVSNPFFRFMSRFIFGHYRSLETYAGDVARRLGETVTVRRLD